MISGMPNLRPIAATSAIGKRDQLRVGQRLRVIGAGAVVGGAGERLGIGGIDEARLDALVLQRVLEQVPGAAVEVGGTDDVVAGARQVLHREGARRLARRQRQRRHPAFHRRDALLQHVVRRVHDAGVDVAQLAAGRTGWRRARRCRTGTTWSGRSAPRRRLVASRRQPACSASVSGCLWSCSPPRFRPCFQPHFTWLGKATNYLTIHIRELCGICRGAGTAAGAARARWPPTGGPNRGPGSGARPAACLSVLRLVRLHPGRGPLLECLAGTLGRFLLPCASVPAPLPGLRDHPPK